MAQGKFVQIGYSNCLTVSKLSRQQLDKIGELKWYFAHASVGANMMDGVADLHQLDPHSFQFKAISAHAAPPAATQPGAIYEHQRGNPGWRTKFDMFHACVSNGWHFPRVDIAMTKLCYIDEHASFHYYVNSMANLQAAYPKTIFVYTTMPLMTAENGDNVLRNIYNARVREWCRDHGGVLFDIADIEAHDPSGTPCTFKYRSKTWQKLCDNYSRDGGHLNTEGRHLVARGFYALGAALSANPAEPQVGRSLSADSGAVPAR